ncbi:MAG: serpin family protein [Chlamydiae bacterium]|nr:serpin family protein [Chlamydiota bacterium]
MGLSQIGRSIYNNGCNFISQLIPSRLPTRYEILSGFAILVILKVAYDQIGKSSKSNSKEVDPKKWPDKPELTETQKVFSRKINHISTEFYQQYSSVKRGKNFIFFPPNLLGMLSLIYLGAPELVKQTFAREFGIDEQFPEDTWHQELQNQNESLTNRSEKPEQPDSNKLKKMVQTIKKIGKHSTDLIYKVSNAIVIRNDTQLNSEVASKIVKYKPEIIRFNNKQDGIQKANGWIEKQTDGQIKDLVKNLQTDPVLFFIVTSIFGGKWIHPFKPQNTRAGNFYNADGTITSIDMMSKGTDEIRYGNFTIEEQGLVGKNEHTFDILELPFHGNVAMIIAKPKEKDKANCEKRMNTLMKEKNFQNLIGYISSPDFKEKKALVITVPKFTCEDEVDLIGDFKNWGLMNQIGGATFNGLLATVSNNQKIPLVIEIVSRTRFEMKEEGVQLVAASYSPTGLQSCDPECTINGPFVYFFWDQQTQSILGCGRVLKLEGAEGKKFERY